MKKTLVALAALASMSAFAQVTITGNLDFAGLKVSGTQLGSNGTTFGTTNGTSSTSAINFSAMEDLGGGMKAQAFYAIDPRTMANDGFALTNSADATPTKNTLTGLGRHEMYVHLAGAFGNIKLGAPNSIGLNVQGDSSPLGTATGSGYAIASGTMMNSVVNTRYNRSVRYDTPTMSGFTASVLYAPGNDQVAVDAVVATQIPNARATTELGLKYSAGPLNASVVQIKQDKQVNKTGYYSGAYSNAAAPADEPVATSATVLGVNYKLDNTTLYYGMNTGDRLAVKSSSDGSKVESKGSRIGIKQTMGQIDLMASLTKQKTTGAAAASATSIGDAQAKVTGVTALYNLSKTAATYIAYEKYDTGVAAIAGTSGALAAVSGDRKTVSIGMRKSF